MSANGTAAQEKPAKKSGSKSSSGRSGAVRIEVDLSDGHAVVVDDDLGRSGERFVPVRFSDGHQRYLRESEISLVEERPSMQQVR